MFLILWKIWPTIFGVKESENTKNIYITLKRFAVFVLLLLVKLESTQFIISLHNRF
jgi:hypothetical protein